MAEADLNGAPPGNNFISPEEMFRLTRTKSQFYELLQRNGFFLPAEKSPLVTLDWMYKVSVVVGAA